jgi:BASS family bile acid:Na+ symporter
MTLAQLIPLAMQASIALIVFSIGLDARFQDLADVLHRPGLLLRSLLAMFVVMPLLAVALSVLFDLNHTVELALVALALAPVPPILPKKQAKAGGAASYAVGLLAIAGLASIVYVPGAVALLARVGGRPVQVDAATLARIIAVSVLMPLLAGLAVARLAPALAQRVGNPLSKFAMLLLLAGFVPILVKQWPAIVALVGNFSVVAIALFSLVGLGIGHALGGPEPEDRTVLALSTATRHPGIALAIGADVADNQALLAAVLLAILVGALVAGPYVKRRARSQAAGAARHRPAG